MRLCQRPQEVAAVTREHQISERFVRPFNGTDLFDIEYN